MIALRCAHETQAALTFMQLAIARADIALDPVVFQETGFHFPGIML
jgi:hypothetical protein